MTAVGMLPELPLGLPAITPIEPKAGGAAGTPKSRPQMTAKKPVSLCIRDGRPVLLVVPIEQIVIDRRFGLSEDELALRHAASIAVEVERIVAGAAQSAYPAVITGGDQRYFVYSEFSIVLAARQVAGSGQNVTVTVIVSPDVPGEALLREVFDKPLGRSLYEQARYIQGCEQIFKSRRAWMRADGIDPKIWETRFSKVGKINQLDPALLEAIDPHTISSAKDAGRIVDLYADPAMRRIARAVVQKASSTSNRPLNAARLFKAIIAAAAGAPPAPALRAADDGSAKLISAKGDVVATLSREGTRWALGAWDAATMTPEIFALALHHARQNAPICSGASLLRTKAEEL